MKSFLNRIKSNKNKTEIKPTTKPEIKPEIKPETIPTVKSQAKPEIKQEVNPQTKQETKIETKPATTPEIKPEVKPETVPTAKPQTKPEIKQEPKVEIKQTTTPEIKPEIKPETVPTAKPQAKPEIKQEVKPAINIYEYGTRNVQTHLKLKTKEGLSVECTLKRRYIVEDGPFGKRVDVNYKVTDSNDKGIAVFDGVVDLSKGIFYGHGIQNYGKRCGLGKTMKQYIAEDAKLYKCKSIDIDAAYGSHMFHNKMGYKCDLTRADYANKNGIDALNAIKTSGTMPEFEQRINSALESKDLSEISTLLDDIFTHANTKNLKSDKLRIVGIQIPMTFKL